MGAMRSKKKTTGKNKKSVGQPESSSKNPARLAHRRAGPPLGRCAGRVVVAGPVAGAGGRRHRQLPAAGARPRGRADDSLWRTAPGRRQPRPGLAELRHLRHATEHGQRHPLAGARRGLDYLSARFAGREIAAIEDHFRGQTFTLVSPYPEQRSPIVLTTWGVQLEVDSIDDDRVDAFIERYRLGPNTPERGAACTNGIGEPTG